MALQQIPALGAVKKKKSGPVTTFGVTTWLADALRGTVYHIDPWSPVLPKFELLRPVGVIYTNTLNVPTRKYTEGLPGVTDRIEWFAIDYEGDFSIDEPGKYRFNLTSDDGSRLYIDGKVVVDNDGIHDTTTIGGSAELAGGRHHIRVSYFQGPRDEVALVLEIAPPGMGLRVFDLRDYRPRSDANIAAAADEAKPNLRRDPAFHGSASLAGYEQAAYEALRATPRPHTFEFRAAAYRFPSWGATTQYVLAFELPGANLTATPEPGQRKSKLHVVLFALVKDASGDVVEKVSRDFLTEVADEQLPALRAGAVTDTRSIALPAGRYTVETAVVDRECGRASTNSFTFDNPVQSQRLGLSSLALVQKVEPTGVKGKVDSSDPFQSQSQRVTPELAANLIAGAEPSVYFVVYPDTSRPETPTIRVEFQLNGELVAQQTAELPPADASGAIRMTIGTIARAGDYRLKITATQGGESAQESIQYSIAAQ